MSESPTRYARNGDVHIAYQVVGEGDLDLLLIDTWVHHVEAVWDFPDYARFLRRLGGIGRVIHFDRRGTGLSDPVPLSDLPDLGTQVGDAVAVLDSAGSDRAAVFGINDGTIVATLLATEHPERCKALALFTLAAGMPLETIDEVIEMIAETAGTDDSGVEMLAPSRVGDIEFNRDLARLQRLSVRPGVFAHYYRQTMEADVRGVLASIETPTLIINRSGNLIVPTDQSRSAADLIKGAKYVELPGTDHLVFSEGVDLVLGEIEEFLTGARTGADPDRMLATLLFTDIVGSTDRAAEMGDSRWRDLLDRHDELTRTEFARHGGHEVSTTGDGFFAYFPRPIAAVKCALALAQAMSGIRLSIRAGIHTGEVEVRDGDLGGLAVHIASRISAEADPGEVWVSSTVKDLLAGTEVEFVDRMERELKGVPGQWRLFQVGL